MNEFQKAELAYGLEGIYSERARLRQLSNLKNVNANVNGKLSSLPNGDNEKEKEKGRTSEILSKTYNIAPRTYQRAKKIIEEGSEQAIQRLREGKTTISKEHLKIQIQQKRSQLMNEKPKMDLPEGCSLLQGDFEELGTTIPDNSIDLIFTDPPYRLQDLDLYEKLGTLANTVLKEGGSLVTFVGQYELLNIGRLVEKSGLKYRWPICVKHTGHYAKMRGFGTIISVAWKPLLWFVKGQDGKTSNNLGWIVNFVESKKPDKIAHEWEQSTVEAEHVIKGLTVENQIVLDPFMGSGTTGAAALQLKRKFIGIEIDKDHYSNAVNRLSNTAT